jgi:hypothetical protein
MRFLILVFIIFLTHLAVANAESVFQYDRIYFFGSVRLPEEPSQSETKHQPESIVDEWAEPVISPSDKISVYVPPQEVRDFLEKPDPENAKAYLAWNLKRIKKFILAQELLAKEAKELGYMEEAKSLLEPGSSVGIKDLKSGVSYLFYFMLKGCPTCEKESKIIDDIYLNHPEIRIEAFAKGFSDQELDGFRFPARQDNGMSSLFKINSYPSIAVFNKKKQRYFLSRFMDEERILKLFQ